LARLKIVVPGGDNPAAARRRFYIFSFVGHSVIALTIAFFPQSKSSGRMISDEFANAIRAELVSAVDSAGGSAAPSNAVKAQPEQKEPEVEEQPKIAPPPTPPPKPIEDEPTGDVKFSDRAEAKPAEDSDDEKPAAASDSKPIENDDLNTPTGEGGGGVGDASGGVQGSGEISIFGWYQNSVSRSLYGSWRQPPLAGQREPLDVVIEFQIQRDGSVIGLQVAQSSGVPALDRSALRAVADASPLPKLPPTWRESRMTASFLFRLNPGDR
jgi:TonB family protein